MKLKVTFREYCLPYIDPETRQEERGDFLGSFDEEIEGATAADILTIAEDKADEYSKKNETDVRVWETAIVVTPRGVRSA